MSLRLSSICLLRITVAPVSEPIPRINNALTLRVSKILPAGTSAKSDFVIRSLQFSDALPGKSLSAYRYVSISSWETRLGVPMFQVLSLLSPVQGLGVETSLALRFKEAGDTEFPEMAFKDTCKWILRSGQG